MRLGNELGLVVHNTVHSYCGLGLLLFLRMARCAQFFSIGLEPPVYAALP